MSVRAVRHLLERRRLGHRKACKTRLLGIHVDQDTLFQFIARHCAKSTESPDPIVSMDTKHKEFLGL